MKNKNKELAISAGYVGKQTNRKIRKWLRNIQKINININHRTHSQTYYYNISGVYQKGEAGILYTDYYTKYPSYKHALNKALNEALKILIDDI